MTSKRVNRIALFLGLAVLATGLLILFLPGNATAVYGNVSPKDVSEIRAFHLTECAKRIGPVWYQDLCPKAIQLQVAAIMNPIEEICGQDNGSAVVLYRAWQVKYYDRPESTVGSIRHSKWRRKRTYGSMVDGSSA
jgi:hypothetical protein